jgi:hypothetical protein
LTYTSSENVNLSQENGVDLVSQNANTGQFAVVTCSGS